MTDNEWKYEEAPEKLIGIFRQLVDLHAWLRMPKEFHAKLSEVENDLYELYKELRDAEFGWVKAEIVGDKNDKNAPIILADVESVIADVPATRSGAMYGLKQADGEWTDNLPIASPRRVGKTFIAKSSL